jgi:hypothetical protein
MVFLSKLDISYEAMQMVIIAVTGKSAIANARLPGLAVASFFFYCGLGGRALARATSRPQEISSGKQSSRSIMHSISVGPS